ncbi:MAG: amidase [Deltaproteobacteria bacterium]|nr:amidase [Deltaproteobacteria bacterium]MBW2413889.1 amidase [Deltaproteobacteria bacterium]
MGFPEYSDYDGLGLAELVRRGDVTPSELCEEAIARIEKHNERLNAVVYKAYEPARGQAASELPNGPFRGVPFLIKDLGCEVAGMPRTSGSRFLAGERDEEDGVLTRRYRDAGVVILGKTNTPELGITGTTESALLGPCRNPWNPDHISGGSSGGSASATAAGIVPLAHASDGLGSIRIPAACCGLFGLKTTRERNPGGPRDGGRVTGYGVDHVVSRSVRDSAAMLDATGYPEPASPYAPAPKERPYMEELATPPGRLRIAFSSETPRGVAIHPENQAALEDTAKLLEELGHDVVERGLGIDYRALYRAQAAVATANSAANYSAMVERIGREAREDELEPLTWAGIRRGQRRSGEEVMAGLRSLRERCREVLSLFEEFDVYLTPVMGTPPPEIGFIDPVNLEPREVGHRQADVFPFTPPFNFTGQPAMSVPLAWSQDGLPLGMQFAARYGDEATLFRLAGQLEQARPWIERRPAVWG